MKKHRFTFIVVGVIIGAIVLIAFLNATKSTKKNMEPVENQTLIYQGNENADNEMLFLFDYACHWCSVWINDIYPIIKSDYIDQDELKFRTQAMVYVNDSSLQFANLDQNLKKYAQADFDHIFYQIIVDAESEPNWGSEQYINDLIEIYQLDHELLLAEPDLDSIQVSRTYTRALEVDVVPTLYINGIKVEDPYDLNQIDKLLK